MEPKKLQQRRNPEADIQQRIMTFMKARGWLCKATHGSAYSAGFPDLYCTHKRWGIRWIEVKLPGMKGSKFTKDQEKWFPLLSQNGTKIWILTAATETEYSKLFKRDKKGQLQDNWLEYFMLKGV